MPFRLVPNLIGANLKSYIGICRIVTIVLNKSLPTGIKSFAYLLLLLACRPVWAQELVETIAKVRLSIVAIGTFQPTRAPSSVFLGTGFVVADGRHVLTNAHVLPDHLDDAKFEKLAVFVASSRWS